jgi:dihydrofolate synthase / folylpolyglutamate synthase
MNLGTLESKFKTHNFLIKMTPKSQSSINQEFESIWSDFSNTKKPSILTEYNLEAIHSILFRLGNPQSGLRIIHVAGTSGKGSTTTLISNILQSQGFKVGSFVSPHIVDMRERIQIGGVMIGEEDFGNYFQIIKKVAKKWKIELSFFEYFVAILLLFFRDQKVDYAVLEVGLGGLLDATNFTHDNKVCVLNSIGLDHTNVLGGTIAKIAVQKAGIIQAGSTVIALKQSPEINGIFESTADQFETKINYVESGLDFDGIKLFLKDNLPFVSFVYRDLDHKIHNLKLSLAGEYQASNCGLALRTVELLAKREGWGIDWNLVLTQLESVSFVGRFQVLKNNFENLTILDGAHNPQKLNSFLTSLFQYYPQSQFNFLIAFKKGKDSKEMLQELAFYGSHIDTLILTAFETRQDSPIQSQDPRELEFMIRGMGFGRVVVIQDLNSALDTLSKTKNQVAVNVITGSLYLVGEVYNLL